MSRSDLLAVARAYHQRRWCIIPVIGKKPIIRWKRYQRQRPSESTLTRWFGSNTGKRPTGVALVLGPVSGNLVARDFDTSEGFAAFEALHPELAATLPRSQTTRGCHVFFRASVDGVKDLGDGELRGARSYVVLPPSVHPDGGSYRWIVEPGDKIPVVDPTLFRPAPETERRRSGETQRRSNGETEAMVCGDFEEILSLPHIEDAIRATAPLSHHKRNRAVFEFARRLKAIPELAELSLLQLDPLVRKWYEHAKPNIGTKEYADTQADFAYGWGRVRVPYGVGLQELWDASEGECPRGLEVLEPSLARLAAFCRRLSSAGGDAPFYLSCRTLADLRGGSKDSAHRDLGALVGFGVLEVAVKGTRGVNGRATRFRYLLGNT